jgi:serine/threonine-protein kinase SRPK3
VSDECTFPTHPISLLQNDDTYWGHDGAEDLEQYRSGGFHPVHLGDEYDEGRYKIVYKIGYGSYSTVWLARDSQRDRYVAIKIVLARFSNHSSEGQIMRIFGSSRPNDTGESYVHLVDDEFYIDGPNGRHLCLVSEPASCEVETLRDGDMLPLDVARAVAAQAILGLCYIHSCGVVHGGTYSYVVQLGSS